MEADLPLFLCCYGLLNAAIRYPKCHHLLLLFFLVFLLSGKIFSLIKVILPIVQQETK